MSALPAKVAIREVSMRDGLQIETPIPLSAKLQLLEAIVATGVREVEATANHPFLTFDGWTALGDLSVGDRVAVPRRVPEPVHTVRLPDEEVVLLEKMQG